MKAIMVMFDSLNRAMLESYAMFMIPVLTVLENIAPASSK